MAKWLLVVVLVLIILGLWAYPALTKGVLTGALSGVKAVFTGSP